MDLTRQYDSGDMAATYMAQALSCESQIDPTRERIPQWLSTCNRSARLLEAGCGAGIDLARYREMGFQNLVGMDASAQQCKLAGERLCGVAPIVCGDAVRLPFSSSSFDIVTSRYMLHYAKDLDAALTELARVMKPEGLLMVVVANPDYDFSCTDNHNGDGTITHTLFDGAVSITYPLRPMEAYIGATFGRYFRMEAHYADPSPTLDDTKPEDRSAMCFLARRKAVLSVQHPIG